MKHSHFFIGVIGLLFALALLIPSNTLTGHIIKEGTCKELGCVEMCDYDQIAKTQQNTCKDEGTVCCFTHWNTGVCDYDVNCEKIREYSLYQSLDQYKETVSERPAPIDLSFKRFFLPMILVLSILGYFALSRNDKTKR